jgi:uncharacterized protein (DUF1697 family)
MAIYVAMLRGINVGGHKKITMDRLRESFEALGFDAVKTHIQSGNIVFKAGKLPPATLSKKIEERIVKDFGFLALVITRTMDEFARAVAGNPFLKKAGIDAAIDIDKDIDKEKLHVMFLPAAPSAPDLKQLQALTTEPDQCRCLGKEIYFYLPNGVAHSSLANNPLERKLLHTATMRNWRTVTTLHRMCLETA